MVILVEATAVTGRYPQVQFVDQPDPSATVRFDFNEAGAWADEDIWPGHDGFSLGAPTLNGEPDGIDTEYGFRQVSFSLIVWATAGGAAPTLSALAKELQRQTNWLRYQHSPGSIPVWYKTYRSAPGAINYEQVIFTDDAEANSWAVAVTLDADALALGERVSLPTVTINNDPAASTNPMMHALPDIKGDAPAYLQAIVTPSTFIAGVTRLAVTSGLSYSAPVIQQADAATLFPSADTGPAVSDATYSGGKYVPITFATFTTLVDRMSGSLPAPPDVGRFAVFARVARSDTTSTFQLRMTLTGSGGVADDQVGDVINLVGSAGATGTATLVNLGEFDLPPSSSWETPRNVSRLPGVVNYTFSASRASGTGSLYVDYFIALPIVSPNWTTTTLRFDQGIGFYGSAYGLAFDGDIDAAVYRWNTYDVMSTDKPPVLSGGFPTVTPGEPNVLTLLLVEGADLNPGDNTSSTNYTDQIALTTTVDMAYYPRYLYLAGV